jgi:hypothetical protein
MAEAQETSEFAGRYADTFEQTENSASVCDNIMLQVCTTHILML